MITPPHPGCVESSSDELQQSCMFVTVHGHRLQELAGQRLHSARARCASSRSPRSATLIRFKDAHPSQPLGFNFCSILLLSLRAGASSFQSNRSRKVLPISSNSRWCRSSSSASRRMSVATTGRVSVREMPVCLDRLFLLCDMGLNRVDKQLQPGGARVGMECGVDVQLLAQALQASGCLRLSLRHRLPPGTYSMSLRSTGCVARHQL